MNMERRVSRVSAAREPPADVRQDVDIIGAVADRVVSDLFDSTRLDPEALFDEVSALTRGTTADLSGISYERLSEELAVRWPAPDETGEGGYRYYDGDGADAEDARDATPTTRTADGRSRPTRAERGSRTRLTGACRSRSTRRTPHAHHRPSSGRVQHRGPDSA